MGKKKIVEAAKSLLKVGGKKPSNDSALRQVAREYGYMLYMQGVSQKDIAERTGITEKTISAWKQEGNWEAKRAAKEIDINQLIGKALMRINEILDSKESFNADSFAKAVAQLKNLKQGNTVDDEVMCFMDFQNYVMQNRAELGVDDAFIKKLTKLQDSYVQWRLGN
jgi:uncharacterized protein YjcR